MSKALRSYPKVWNMGHPSIRDLFSGPVVVQEKIDGSQFSFGVVDGGLHFRSKGAAIYAATTDKLFRQAVGTAVDLFADGKLEEGWIYRAEAMMGPKHNALQYERAPDAGMVLFDVDTGLEDRVAEPDRLRDIAEELGLEHAPTLHVGEITNVEHLKDMLTATPLLGGKMVEGVVVKNYARWGEDGKMLMGKVVAEAFREVNKSNWKKDNPSRTDVLQSLIEQYRTEARWQKAVQHLREAGTLEEDPRDIGKLIKEVGNDLHAECADEIKEALFKHFWKDIQRGSTRGLPEFYKRQLAEQQFAEADAAA